MSTLSVGFVVGMYVVGCLIGDKKLGMMAAAFAAVSSAQVTQSTNLSNQSPVGLCALGALASGILVLRRGYLRDSFFTGFFVGLASSFHLQGVSLLVWLPVVLLWRWQKFIQHSFVVSIGVLIPWVPVFYIDGFRHWVNMRNMSYYFFVDQYNISFETLGRRWITYLLYDIPRIWGFIIGGSPLAGGILLIMTCYVLMKSIHHVKKKNLILPILFATSIFFLLLRYVRQPP